MGYDDETIERYNLIIQNIKMCDSSLDFDDDFYYLVFDRLKGFGLDVVVDDSLTISFAMSKVKNHILSVCNVNIIPTQCEQIFVDMICGEVLNIKNQKGELADTLPDEASVKSIQLGDTNVTFAVDNSVTSEDRLKNLINYLLHNKEGDLISYRKVKW